MKPIITNLLDTDFYKFTMWQALRNSHPEATAKYIFVCRNKPLFPLTILEKAVNEQLDHLCSLKFSFYDIRYLQTLPEMKSDFTEFLSTFQFKRELIKVSQEGQNLIVCAEGPQVEVMGFEIYVLAIINELYFQCLDGPNFSQWGVDRLLNKIEMIKNIGVNERKHPFEFFDFGTRRRLSHDWQRKVVAELYKNLPRHFKGTSNVFMSGMDTPYPPVGTMAHEYLQSYQAFSPTLRGFQKAALNAWVEEYRGRLAIALTDVIGMDAFLSDFDLLRSKIFDGLRHDSGDPFEWGEKAIAHYEKMGIDPNSKKLVFSDGLNVTKSILLYQHFGDRIKTGFGIGTNLTNDVGHIPLNIVMKIIECNGKPVAKLSDAPGKTLCKDEEYLQLLRQTFNLTK